MRYIRSPSIQLPLLDRPLSLPQLRTQLLYTKASATAVVLAVSIFYRFSLVLARGITETTCLDHPKTIKDVAARSYDLPTIGSLSQSYAVGSDGVTYISPSVYVAFGDVTAGNMCGTVGAVHTSVTLAFAPGELSTYDWRGGVRAFDPNDLPCGPGQPFYWGPMGIQGVPAGEIYKATIKMAEIQHGPRVKAIFTKGWILRMCLLQWQSWILPSLPWAHLPR